MAFAFNLAGFLALGAAVGFIMYAVLFGGPS